MTITTDKKPEELSGSETFPQQGCIITAFLNERLNFCETALNSLIKAKLSMSEHVLLQRSSEKSYHNHAISEEFENVGYKIDETMEVILMLKTTKAAFEMNNGPIKVVMDVRIKIYRELSSYIDRCIQENLKAKETYKEASVEILADYLQKGIQRAEEDTMLLLNVRHAFINQFIKA